MVSLDSFFGIIDRKRVFTFSLKIKIVDTMSAGWLNIYTDFPRVLTQCCVECINTSNPALSPKACLHTDGSLYLIPTSSDLPSVGHYLTISGSVLLSASS